MAQAPSRALDGYVKTLVAEYNSAIEKRPEFRLSLTLTFRYMDGSSEVLQTFSCHGDDGSTLQLPGLVTERSTTLHLELSMKFIIGIQFPQEEPGAVQWQRAAESIKGYETVSVNRDDMMWDRQVRDMTEVVRLFNCDKTYSAAGAAPNERVLCPCAESVENLLKTGETLVFSNATVSKDVVSLTSLNSVWTPSFQVPKGQNVTPYIPSVHWLTEVVTFGGKEHTTTDIVAMVNANEARSSASAGGEMSQNTPKTGGAGIKDSRRCRKCSNFV